MPPTDDTDKSELQAAVDEAAAFLESINKEEYEQDAVDAVQAAIDNANTVLSAEDVDQETVDAALQQLEAALDQLYDAKKDDSTQQPGGEDPGDKTPSGDDKTDGQGRNTGKGTSGSVKTGDPSVPLAMSAMLVTAAAAAGISATRLCRSRCRQRRH